MKISDSFRTSFVVYSTEQHQTLYDILITQSGIDQFTFAVKGFQEKSQDELMKTVPTPINRQIRSSQSKSQFQQFPIQKSFFEDPNIVQLTFYQFVNLIDDFFVDTNECQIMEWFQLLQMNEKIVIRDIYIMLLLFLSRESRQQFDFLYQYGEYLFESLKQGNNKVLGLTLKIFAKLIGLSARQSQILFKELKIKQNEEYSFEDFEIFCFTFLNPENAQGQGSQQKYIKQNLQKQPEMNQSLIVKQKFSKL